MKFFRFISVGTITLFTLGLIGNFSLASPYSHPIGTWWMTAQAEREDEDEDEEDEDDREDETNTQKETKTSKPKTIQVIKEVVEYKPVTETIVVTEEAYTKDTDGDLLVDALDPDPRIAQSEYFTDIDGDGVPNAIDRYHDEDDFAYYEMETDDNENGILDSYEQQ
jgi:hypothetical protein